MNAWIIVSGRFPLGEDYYIVVWGAWANILGVFRSEIASIFQELALSGPSLQGFGEG